MMGTTNGSNDLFTEIGSLRRENVRLDGQLRADRNESNRIILELREANTELTKANEQCEIQNKELAEQLKTARYMRRLVGKCRDDAEARAGGYGHYHIGGV